jgi:hypothetical protein
MAKGKRPSFRCTRVVPERHDTRSGPTAGDWDKFSVYEITLATGLPNPNFLRRRVDLEEFKTKYQECLRHIRRKHPSVRAISLFPAIPAPIAVVCGRELLPKVDPELRVFDFDKSRGGFTRKTVANPDESK